MSPLIYHRQAFDPFAFSPPQPPSRESEDFYICKAGCHCISLPITIVRVKLVVEGNSNSKLIKNILQETILKNSK